MNGTENSDLHPTNQRPAGGGEVHTRVHGSPLPVGGAGRAPLPPRQETSQGARSISLPGRGLTQDAAGSDATASVQRAIVALRSAFPFLQKILPLMENNLGNAVSNFLTTHAQNAPPPSAPPLDLEPIENHLAELRAHQRDLRNQVLEQNTSIKRVEDQLDQVREATDRNTLEQQELIEDLKTVGTKVNFFAVLVLLLLAGSVLLNILLYLHISRILP
jgi:hypothetical protein